MKTLLKVLVGSQAHGLATPESDYDYRGVFITPTQEILSLGNTSKNTQWIEGKQDDTSWEVGKFLFMALQCNPTVLEVFKAPVVAMEERDPGELSNGTQLRHLFSAIWTPDKAADAFIGYGLNQRKKFLDEKDGRPHKYAVAYLRTLYQAWQLLCTGDFSVNMKDTEVYDTLKRLKSGDYEMGEVITICIEWEKRVRMAQQTCPPRTPNTKVVNDFLLKIRKENWT